jgi:hypothetical protein
MTAFDEHARAVFRGGQVPATGSHAARSALTDLVIEVVYPGGYQVIVDIANQ